MKYNKIFFLVQENIKWNKYIEITINFEFLFNNKRVMG